MMFISTAQINDTSIVRFRCNIRAPENNLVISKEGKWIPCLFYWHKPSTNEWRFSTAWYGTVRFTFGGFSTGFCTWYFFNTTSAGVPSDPYHYQNMTRKLYWSLIGRRKSSLLRHWTCDTRPNIYPLDLNQHRQRKIGHNFCLNKHTFLYQPKISSFVVCWGSTDVPLIDSRSADPARAWWRDAE